MPGEGRIVVKGINYSWKLNGDKVLSERGKIWKEVISLSPFRIFVSLPSQGAIMFPQSKGSRATFIIAISPLFLKGGTGGDLETTAFKNPP